MYSCVCLISMQRLECRCQRNLRPAACTHSAAAACKACEHAHRASRQHGAPVCYHPRCSRRAGCCSAGRGSGCRFESTSSQLRSDADSTATVPLGTTIAHTVRCSSDLCMLLCRCGAGDAWRPATSRRRWSACLRAVRPSPQSLQGKAICLPSWQVLPQLLQ